MLSITATGPEHLEPSMNASVYKCSRVKGETAKARNRVMQQDNHHKHSSKSLHCNPPAKALKCDVQIAVKRSEPNSSTVDVGGTDKVIEK